MWQSIRSVASPLLSFWLLLVANGMFNTLLSLRGKMEGFSTETIGFVMAGFFLGLLLGSTYAMRVVAAVGHIRSFAAFASIMSVAVLGHVLWIDPVVWFAFRTVAGFCMAGMLMVVESWINENADNNTRGQILSLYMMINYLGSGLGQFMITVADPAQFQLFVIASMIFSVALVPILLTRSGSPKPSSPKPMNPRALYRISPVGYLGTICAGMLGSSINGMGPIFASDSGLPIVGVSTFMACVILGGMALQFPIGRLSDRFDRRTILAFVAFSTVLAAAGIIWVLDMPPIWLFVAAAIYGGFSYTLYPLSSAQVNDLADPDRMVQISAGLLLAYGVGASMGPIAASQMMGQFGPPGMFIWNGGMVAALGIFTAYRMVRRDRSDKLKPSFMPLAGQGVSSRQLYVTTLKQFFKSRKNPDTK